MTYLEHILLYNVIILRAFMVVTVWLWNCLTVTYFRLYHTTNNVCFCSPWWIENITMRHGVKVAQIWKYAVISKYNWKSCFFLFIILFWLTTCRKIILLLIEYNPYIFDNLKFHTFDISKCNTRVIWLHHCRDLFHLWSSLKLTSYNQSFKFSISMTLSILLRRSKK